MENPYALAFTVCVALGSEHLGRDTLCAVPITVQLRRQTVVSSHSVAILLSIGALDDVRHVIECTRVPERDIRVPAYVISSFHVQTTELPLTCMSSASIMNH